MLSWQLSSSFTLSSPPPCCTALWGCLWQPSCLTGLPPAPCELKWRPLLLPVAPQKVMWLNAANEVPVLLGGGYVSSPLQVVNNSYRFDTWRTTYKFLPLFLGPVSREVPGWRAMAALPVPPEQLTGGCSLQLLHAGICIWIWPWASHLDQSGTCFSTGNSEASLCSFPSYYKSLKCILFGTLVWVSASPPVNCYWGEQFWSHNNSCCLYKIFFFAGIVDGLVLYGFGFD